MSNLSKILAQEINDDIKTKAEEVKRDRETLKELRKKKTNDEKLETKE